MAEHFKTRLIVISLLLAVALSGCSISPSTILDSDDGAPRSTIDVSNIPNATPRMEPRSRYGNPDSYVVFGKRYYVKQSSQGYVERGTASWYGTKFHGRRTSSGETYDMYAMTAAHKSLPLPTYAQVTNLDNGRSVVVKINDRGPFHGDRIIDLSYTAASKLGILKRGTGRVEVRAIDTRQGPTAPAPTPLKVAGENSDFYIQVGAFNNRTNADQLAERLANSLNRNIRVTQSINNEGFVFRVQVGPLASTVQADDLSLKLAQLGINNVRVVMD